MDLSLLFLALVALSSAFLQTTIGFGFPIFAMAFLPFLYPYHTAVALIQIIAISNTLFLSLKYRRQIRWKVLLPVLIPSLSFGILTTLFSYTIDVHYLKVFLGGFLFLLGLYFILFASRIHIKASLQNGLITGVVAGAGNGFFGVGGPPAALYFLSAFEGDKTAYIANIETFFTCGNIVNCTLRMALGAFTLSSIPDITVGQVGVGLGSVLGLWSFKKIPAPLLKSFVYAFICLNGIWIVIEELFL